MIRYMPCTNIYILYFRDVGCLSIYHSKRIKLDWKWDHELASGIISKVLYLPFSRYLRRWKDLTPNTFALDLVGMVQFYLGWDQ